MGKDVSRGSFARCAEYVQRERDRDHPEQYKEHMLQSVVNERPLWEVTLERIHKAQAEGKSLQELARDVERACGRNFSKKLLESGLRALLKQELIVYQKKTGRYFTANRDDLPL